jgi:hypothetical protein
MIVTVCIVSCKSTGTIRSQSDGLKVTNVFMYTVLSLRAGTRYFYPATVASGTGRKNNKKKTGAKI